MVTFGVSLYPEQEKTAEIDRYLQVAATNGFTKVFTSMFSVNKSKAEIMADFKQASELAHKHGMTIFVDVHPFVFETLGATATDLSIFAEMGIDGIRMDMVFGDERDVQLVDNDYGIIIEYNPMMIDAVEPIFQNIHKKQNFQVCHNFYPQKYTALDMPFFEELSTYWHDKEVRVGAFVSSQESGTHGPWPVSDGLPSIEEHRNLPIDLQVRHFLMMGTIDEIIIGNTYASDAELESIKYIIDDLFKEEEVTDQRLANFAKSLKRKMYLRANIEKDLSPEERALAIDFRLNADFGDKTSYMLRSRFGRFSKKTIHPRPVADEYFERGDILIVNSNLAHYQGEVQIALKRMKNDGQRNRIGKILAEEEILLNYFAARDVFIVKEQTDL